MLIVYLWSTDNENGSSIVANAFLPVTATQNVLTLHELYFGDGLIFCRPDMTFVVDWELRTSYLFLLVFSNSIVYSPRSSCMYITCIIASPLPHIAPRTLDSRMPMGIGVLLQAS